MSRSRRCKAGLDYFSFDVDFFDDEKIEFVSARYGLKGEVISIRLLCRIYRNGYFIKWGDDESLLFAKRVGDGVTQEDVKCVVDELFKREFLSKSLFDKCGILTSGGIQKRYIQATERRKGVEMIKDYIAVDITDYDVDILELNDDISKQSKVKESKVKESKEDYKISFSEFWEVYPSRNGKKIDKPTTKDKFYKLKPSDLSDIIVAVHNYKDSELVKQGIGIKDPHRFISNKDNKEFWKEWMKPEINNSKKQKSPYEAQNETRAYHKPIKNRGL
jgi:hypothetical protein